MPHRQRTVIECVAAIAAALAVQAGASMLQVPIALTERSGWDGLHYLTLATQIRDGLSPMVPAPFVYRVGVPSLVALVSPGNLQWGFELISLVSTGVTAAALMALTARFVRRASVRWFVLGLFLMSWQGPARFGAFYPVLTDAPALAMLTTGLVLILWAHECRWALWWLPVHVALTVWIREAGFLLIVAIFAEVAIRNDRRRAEQYVVAALSAAAGLLVAIVVHQAVQPTNEFSFMQTAWNWTRNKSVLGYCVAWFAVFGPVLALTISTSSWRLLSAHVSLASYLAAVAALAWIGGSDTERILLWSMPVVLLLIGDAFDMHWQRLTRWQAVFASGLAAQAVCQRILWTIPDPSTRALTWIPPAAGFGRYVDLWTQLAWQPLVTRAAIEYFILAATALFVVYGLPHADLVVPGAATENSALVPERCSSVNIAPTSSEQTS
jgi:hypothetical protein